MNIFDYYDIIVNNATQSAYDLLGIVLTLLAFVVRVIRVTRQACQHTTVDLRVAHPLDLVVVVRQFASVLWNKFQPVGATHSHFQCRRMQTGTIDSVLSTCIVQRCSFAKSIFMTYARD